MAVGGAAGANGCCLSQSNGERLSVIGMGRNQQGQTTGCPLSGEAPRPASGKSNLGAANPATPTEGTTERKL